MCLKPRTYKMFLKELPMGQLQCVELFAGVATLASAWREAGYNSRAIDVESFPATVVPTLFLVLGRLGSFINLQSG